MILVKPSSLARVIARLKASASAISGDVTSSCYSLQAVKHTPLWSLITTPTPIRRETGKIAASTLTKTMPVGCGDHFSIDDLISHL
jgi:hypothetical protein